LKGKKIVTQKWKTIFNSELACLRYAYEVIGELDKTPGKKWSDPEFGATPTDEFGSKSMYFGDNVIPDGCPDPKDVQWLRPEEILGHLVERGNDEYVGKVACFIEDGAESNDVC
jgi:predicted nucleotidyltransferase